MHAQYTLFQKNVQIYIQAHWCLHCKRCCPAYNLQTIHSKYCKKMWIHARYNDIWNSDIITLTYTPAHHCHCIQKYHHQYQSTLVLFWLSPITTIMQQHTFWKVSAVSLRKQVPSLRLIVTDMVNSNDFGTQYMHGWVLYLIQCHNVLPVLNIYSHELPDSDTCRRIPATKVFMLLEPNSY